MSDEWYPCPKCGKLRDKHGWREPQIGDFCLEPHVCDFIVDIKAVVWGGFAFAALFINSLHDSPLWPW